MEFAFLVKGSTKRDIFCTLGYFSLQYAVCTFHDFIINPSRCDSHGHVLITVLMMKIVALEIHFNMYHLIRCLCFLDFAWEVFN